LQQPDEIILVIPAKKGWTIIFVVAWLVFWLCFFPLVLRFLQSLAAHPETADWLGVFWCVDWVLGVVFAVWSIMWALGGKEFIQVNSSRLDLRATIFGITTRRRSTAVNEVRNLRFVPAHSHGRRSRASCICYEDENGTAKFGSELSDAEGLAVIDKMLNVFPFSTRDKTLEDMDLS
jgi:hypothetical protein